MAEQGKAEAAIALFDEVERRYGRDATPAVRVQVVRALVSKSVTLMARRSNYFNFGTDTLGIRRDEEAIALLTETERRYGEDAALAVREIIAKELVDKGVALQKQEDYKQRVAVVVFEEVDRRYKEDPAPEMRILVAKALLNDTKGWQGMRLFGHCTNLDEIVRRYREEGISSPEMREIVAEALSRSCSIRNGVVDDLGIFDELDRLYRKDIPLKMRELAARKLLGKGEYWMRFGKHAAEAIAILDEIERRCGKDTSPDVREIAARALLNKGKLLTQQEKYTEAIAIFDKIERRYGKDTAPNVRAQVNAALLDKSIAIAKREASK
jgi:tetratricopeptide (TPR) repeat protein